MSAGMAVSATHPVNPYPSTTAPNYRQLHYMNRLGCGYSRGTTAQLRSAGSAAAWLEQQLAPSTITESTTALALPSWFPELDEAPATKWAKATAKNRGAWGVRP
jgi:hypothetical protein